VTLADARFFVGTVAMMNSLRVTGNDGELVVFDRGLTDEQRRLLRDYARVVPVDPGIRPFLVTPSMRNVADSGTLYWIDGDVIVTRNLRHISELAESGKICLYYDNPPIRWFREWEDIFALQAPLRRERYLNVGFLSLSRDRWEWLLERWSEVCAIMPPLSAYTGEKENPVLGGDQDALNALLMSEVSRNAVHELPVEEVVYTGVMHQARVVSREELVCIRRGRRTAVLHYVGKLKPWMPESWGRINRDAYVRLLQRLLFEQDVELRLAFGYVPPWLRPTPRGRLFLSGLRLVHGPRARLQDAARAVVHRLPRPIREPVLRFRGEIMHGRR
jgi:Glycosyl transferase family 8